MSRDPGLVDEMYQKLHGGSWNCRTSLAGQEVRGYSVERPSQEESDYASIWVETPEVFLLSLKEKSDSREDKKREKREEEVPLVPPPYVPPQAPPLPDNENAQEQAEAPPRGPMTRQRFVDRLRSQVERQVQDPVVQAELIKEMAQRNANETCGKIILSLPLDPSPSLAQMIEACTKRAELFSAPERNPGLTHPKPVAAAAPGARKQPMSSDQLQHIICHRCKRPGHFAKACPENQKHLLIGQSKTITEPQELIAQLIRKARVRLCELAGCDFTCIHLPVKLSKEGRNSPKRLTKEMFEHLLQSNASLQLSLDSYRGQISVHAPSHKLLNEEFHLIPCEKRSRRPLKALTVFTDASGASHKSVMTWRNPQTQRWEADVEFVEGSPQVAELAAVVRAFEKFSEQINLVTDSAYVAGVVSRAEQAVLKEIDNEHLFRLLSKLIYLISHREHPFYVMLVRSHMDLPGKVAEGNRQADSLAAPVEKARLPDIFQQAKLSHQQYHQNVPGLIRQFQLTRSQAGAIVATCPNCQVQAMPSMGEKTEHAKKHLVQAFSMLGIPKEIKTDNGPAYTSKGFLEFVQQWGVEHKTGIPHSPTGQAVVERAHQTLKQVLARQSSTTVWMSPHEKRRKAMFTINFLNCSFENMSPPVVRHFNSGNQFKLSQRPPVMIRDPETWETKGPYELVTWGRGYACVATPSGPRWIPQKESLPHTQPCDEPHTSCHLIVAEQSGSCIDHPSAASKCLGDPGTDTSAGKHMFVHCINRKSCVHLSEQFWGLVHGIWPRLKRDRRRDGRSLFGPPGQLAKREQPGTSNEEERRRVSIPAAGKGDVRVGV
ncbi:hypothetical protein DUI87_06070 [Hirundo rustica rustica]|uniref:RNA-directed DNA polymerase n=1 Tax=Hirundo rustica rustica TaxID=333673 RepID=A0A3M0LCA1_HIRRU|nr:hypothetical protein DUI87_06070 [Hirundo rustica rustica]